MTFSPLPGTLVIGFGYRAQQGKDVAARIIAARTAADTHRFALSDGISAVARACHGMGVRDPRMLQLVGLACRRKDPDVWLRTLYGAIQDRAPQLALVTGVRFPDEAALVRSMGGVVVEVRRWNPDGSRFVSADRDPDHPTEHGLDGFDFDYTLDNHGLEAFEDAVLCLYQAVCLRKER